MIQLLLNILFASAVFAFALHDKKAIESSKETYVADFPQMFTRFMAIFATAFFMAISLDVQYPEGLLILLGLFVMYWGIFWLVFDMMLNLIRGKDIDYVSTTNNKLTDKIFKGSFALQLLAKLALIATGAVILISVF